MLCRTSTLRAEMRRNERREEALLQMVRELSDRLAALSGKPWTLPPRPVPAEQKPDPVLAAYGPLEEL